MRVRPFNLLSGVSAVVALFILLMALGTPYHLRTHVFEWGPYSLTFNHNYLFVSRLETVSVPHIDRWYWVNDLISLRRGAWHVKGVGPAYEEGWIFMISHAITVPLALILPIAWLNKSVKRHREHRRRGFEVLPPQPIQPNPTPPPTTDNEPPITNH